MTIQAAIDRIDVLKPNMFTAQQKVAWLSELDGMVFREIFLTHEGMPAGVTYEGYNEDTQTCTTLLVPEPYTDIYQHYMAVQMDLANAEGNKYAQDTTLFHNAWQTFADFWTRLHMPISRVREFRL